MNIIEEILNRVSLADVLEMYDMHPRNGRNNYICPFHKDKHPSAGITKKGNQFHCFSCGWTGNQLDIVQQFEKCGIKEAMRILDDKFKLGLFGHMDKEELRELSKQIREREKEKRKKEEKRNQIEKIRRKIIEQIRFWEKVQETSHITRGEFKKGEWVLSDMFFKPLKEQERLNWLYEVVCEVNHPECEWEYFYGSDYEMILDKLIKGEIEI